MSFIDVDNDNDIDWPINLYDYIYDRPAF